MLFKPFDIIGDITDLTPDFLKQHGITGLLLDVDNTLTTAHASGLLREGVPAWLNEMTKQGIKLMILSNAKEHRIAPFANKIGLDFLPLAAKPLPFGYWKAARKMQMKHKQIAMIGDQIFTDVLGGKLAGIKTILAIDIVPEDKRSFRIRRYFEDKLLKRYGYARKKG